MPQQIALASLEMDVAGVRHLTCAQAAVMGIHCASRHDHAPSTRPKAFRRDEFFLEEKRILIESADLAKSPGSERHARAADRIYGDARLDFC
jgi:hypothetical protein